MLHDRKSLSNGKKTGNVFNLTVQSWVDYLPVL